MSKIIALSCTHKPQNSLTDEYLAAAVEGYLEENTQDEVTVIRLINYRLKLCVGNDECLETGVCPLEDDFYEIIRLADGAVGLILCMPVYGGNVPSILKIFMERLKTFMKQERRPFGGLDVCTIVHSRAMLTEAALGALSPWFMRLKNRNVVSVCLTKSGISDMSQSRSHHLCRNAGAQLAIHINGLG